MSEEELKALNKEAKKRRRIATEKASEVHDLVEERLWSDYEQLPELAAQVREACVAWAEAEAAYKAASA